MVVSTDLENKCLTLLIWHGIEIGDEVRVSTCSLKVRFESNIIPRSLTENTGIHCCPRKGTLISSTLLQSCFVPKKISLVLSGLISNLFVQHQEAIRVNKSEIFRDFCKAGVDVFLWTRKINLCVVNIWLYTWKLLATDGRSFMHVKTEHKRP